MRRGRQRTGAAVWCEDEATGWDTISAETSELRDLEDDWDGQGAVAPLTGVVEAGISLAERLRVNGWPAPARVISSVNGTVIFEWHWADGGYTEVEVVSPTDAEFRSVPARLGGRCGSAFRHPPLAVSLGTSMPVKPETAPIAADEWLLRLVWGDWITECGTPIISPHAFEPRKDETTGISMFRQDCLDCFEDCALGNRRAQACPLCDRRAAGDISPRQATDNPTVPDCHSPWPRPCSGNQHRGLQGSQSSLHSGAVGSRNGGERTHTSTPFVIGARHADESPDAFEGRVEPHPANQPAGG